MRILAIVFIAGLIPPPGLLAGEGRAFWLTRWNGRDAAGIISCLDGMKAIRANMLFCQVYGDGMALYDSAIAPRSHLVAADFDALAVAVAEGHRRGIEVHAFINICNVWSGGLGAPWHPSHITRTHPEWAVVDSGGTSDIAFLEDPSTPVFFCPEWKGFRDHCVSIAREIARNYDVDGIHLDYLRHPGGPPRCFCPEHRRNFQARFGRPPEDGDPDFIEWRFATITGLFTEIYDALSAERPDIKVSAALVAPTARYFQDARRILEAGKLDLAMPMIYTADTAFFQDQARSFHENSGGRLVFAGIASDSGKVGEEAGITRSVGLEGQALFAWSNLDDAARAEMAGLWAAPAAVPAMPWKDGSADRTAPVVSGLRVEGVLDTEAAVLWHTDERCRVRVEFGTTAALGRAAGQLAFGFDHVVRLWALKPSTRYEFVAVSIDLAGNTVRSARASFTTAAGGPVEVIVDDGGDGFSRGGAWSQGSSAGGWGTGYLFSSDQPEETAFALWRPFLPRTGDYEVSVWYVAGGNRVQDAPCTVVHGGGNTLFSLDQRSGGGQWNVLGRFSFNEGSGGYVRLSNKATGGDVIIADAVRFRLLDSDPIFLRGDANRDGDVELGDAVAVLFHLFGGRPVSCPDAADTDDSGRLDLADAVAILMHLFRGGPPPAPPGEVLGPDPTADTLGACN